MPGRFFEDFRTGETIVHAPPRTLGTGEAALYTALTGARTALCSADTVARACGWPAAPLDDWLVFHLVFGQSVADISRHAIANLGYAEGRWGVRLWPGDTLSARSTVIGLRQTSAGDAGVVHVRTTGSNQRGEMAVEYVRWVLVRKRDPAAPCPPPVAPVLCEPKVEAPTGFRIAKWDPEWSGSARAFEDYAPGERIDHGDGTTIEEAEHQMATRLYHNTARVHFDAAAARDGRRLVYGGHVISLARGLAHAGLENAVLAAALHGGRHAAPCHGGDTLFAWSAVTAASALPGRQDLGALRLRTVATRNHPAGDFPGADAPHPAVVLDLDWTVLVPRRAVIAPA